MNENYDLYRQMLLDAYKVKDIKLTRLVQKRLVPHLKTSRESCNKIIPFPAAPVFCIETEPSLFGQEQQFLTGPSQLFILLGFTGVWLFYPVMAWLFMP